MQPRVWLLSTAILIAAGAAAVIGFNIAVDPYGLYRDTHGRHLAAYGDERIAKYLLSARYVPENFDSLLIGSSVSANWDTSAIGGLRVYNESINGGDIAEEKSLLDQALARGAIKTVFLVVHPYLTESHEFKTAVLSPDLKFSALGSLSLLEAYKEMVKVRLHRAPQTFDDSGVENFGGLAKELNPLLKRMMRPGVDFEVDGAALSLYREAVDELRRQHTGIVFVVPPVFDDLLHGKAAAFQKYTQMILAEAGPDEQVIDFTAEQYAGLRRNRDNFGDGVHLTPKAAKEVVAAINQAITVRHAARR